MNGLEWVLGKDGRFRLVDPNGGWPDNLRKRALIWLAARLFWGKTLVGRTDGNAWATVRRFHGAYHAECAYQSIAFASPFDALRAAYVEYGVIEGSWREAW